MSDLAPTEHFDVLIVGAGISGIGAAYHLSQEHPNRSFVMLEALADFGGTWRTHQYPGVRSDSDLYTFGYRFKPWTSAPIATGGEILRYLREVIDEHDIERHIRYRHHISRATWSSDDDVWTVEVTDSSNPDAPMARRFTTNFLWMCQGYYRHSKGYTPEWPGTDRFQGRIVHPQHWPTDLDYTDKRVVVIGSGATAATLVPAIADKVAHVTMLQRSPTYFISRPNVNETADMLRGLDIPEEWIHEICRRKSLQEQGMLTELSVSMPEVVRDELIKGVAALLPEGYPVERDFAPTYRPWQQRLALIPNGDLFAGISSGKASVVTDDIDTFTETGIRTKSGDELPADIIVTATGFDLCLLGDIEFEVDGAPVDFANTVSYRGMMFTGVPNLMWVMGYFRASWTLRADLIGDFTCRLLQHMDDLGVRRVTPRLRPQDADMPLLDWISDDNFNPGYLQRGMHLMPKRGDRPEWQHTQDYWVEKDALPAADLDDGCLEFA